MAEPDSRREKLFLSLDIVRVLDERYAHLGRPLTVLQMFLTNMRNRPLTIENIKSMRMSVLSLYHSLFTGSKDFPVIESEGLLHFLHMSSPFNEEMEPDNWENARPSPFTRTPPGMLVPSAGSSTRTIFTPVIPERANMEVLKGDRRNCVRTLESSDGTTFTRVISPVYRKKDTELTNRWRVTDYNAEGQLIMSALCQFVESSVPLAKTKRKQPEEESSSSSPSAPRKRFRV